MSLPTGTRTTGRAAREDRTPARSGGVRRRGRGAVRAGSRLGLDEDPEQNKWRLAVGNICEGASQVECAQVGKHDLHGKLEAALVPERPHQRAAPPPKPIFPAAPASPAEASKHKNLCESAGEESRNRTRRPAGLPACTSAHLRRGGGTTLIFSPTRPLRNNPAAGVSPSAETCRESCRANAESRHPSVQCVKGQP